MVSTRRKAATTGPQAAEPEPQLQPAAVAPRRGLRTTSDAQPQNSQEGAAPALAAVPSSAPSPGTAPVPSETTTSDHDRIWLNRYREMIQKEKDEAAKTVFTRAARTVKLAWHHYRISMAPFMLEPWEQFIYILLILLVAYGFGHAVMRTIDLARPMLAAKLNGWAPALNNHVNSL